MFFNILNKIETFINNKHLLINNKHLLLINSTNYDF